MSNKTAPIYPRASQHEHVRRALAHLAIAARELRAAAKFDPKVGRRVEDVESVAVLIQMDKTLSDAEKTGGER